MRIHAFRRSARFNSSLGNVAWIYPEIAGEDQKRRGAMRFGEPSDAFQHVGESLFIQSLLFFAGRFFFRRLRVRDKEVRIGGMDEPDVVVFVFAVARRRPLDNEAERNERAGE